jgi:hypothetical protein
LISFWGVQVSRLLDGSLAQSNKTVRSYIVKNIILQTTPLNVQTAPHSHQAPGLRRRIDAVIIIIITRPTCSELSCYRA